MQNIPLITKQQMIDFIMAQPDDRPINMLNPDYYPSSNKCGCLMVEYAKDNFKISDECINVGFSAIYKGNDMEDVAELTFDMDDLVIGGFENESKTFGELKKHLKN
jgi:hypothetical protein